MKPASELKKGDTCIIKDKMYRITAIWRFQKKVWIVLFCDADNSKIERVYPNVVCFELDESGSHSYAILN
jgi:hypothetical protein